MLELLNHLYWNGPTKYWDLLFATSEALENKFVTKMGDYMVLTPLGYAHIFNIKNN